MSVSLTLPQILVLETLAAVSKKHNKRWCIISRNTIATLLEDHYELIRGVKTISRTTTSLLRGNYIDRRRRTKHVPGVGRVFSANLYKVTGPGYKLLKRLCYQLSWIVGGPRGTQKSHNLSLRSANDTKRRSGSSGPAVFERGRPPPIKPLPDLDPISPDQKKIIASEFWKKRGKASKF